MHHNLYIVRVRTYLMVRISMYIQNKMVSVERTQDHLVMRVLRVYSRVVMIIIHVLRRSYLERTSYEYRNVDISSTSHAPWAVLTGRLSALRLDVAEQSFPGDCRHTETVGRSHLSK